MSRSRTIAAVALSALALVATAAAPARRAAAATVLDGDPIDPSTGLPWVILPGAPLVSPGPDGRYGTGDDLIDPSVVGDVDLVIRTGGTFGGGAFPPPASSPATAPAVTAGGAALGTQVPFDLVASDGSSPPAAGNPIADLSLDGHGALVLAFADLDGDGVIGPNGADGSADDEIERQEILTPVGRRVAVFLGGIASGSLGVSAGAPASAGGLGLVLVGGAVTGTTPPLFTDAAWVATLLPFVPSADPRRILGGNPQPPDPNFLADVEIEFASTRHFVPTGTHPIIGTPFAIPLDGSRPSVDLARSESGPAIAAGLGLEVDAASFVAVPGRQLAAAVDPAGGTRLLLDRASSLALPDDGPGNGATVFVYPADRLGNPADPSSPLTVEIEASPGLAIVAPDTDADPSRESLTLDTAASLAIAIDDAGVAGDSIGSARLVASAAGRPSAAIDVTLGGGGGPAPLPWATAMARLRLGRRPAAASAVLVGRFALDPAAFDPTATALTLRLESATGLLYARTFAAGSLQPNARATRFSFREPASAAPPRVRALALRRPARDPTGHRLRLSLRGLDLSAFDPSTPTLTLTLEAGATTVRSAITCAPNGRGTVTRCELP